MRIMSCVKTKLMCPGVVMRVRILLSFCREKILNTLIMHVWCTYLGVPDGWRYRWLLFITKKLFYLPKNIFYIVSEIHLRLKSLNDLKKTLFLRYHSAFYYS